MEVTLTSLPRSEFKKLKRALWKNWTKEAREKLEELGFEHQPTSLNNRALWSPLKIPCFYRGFLFVHATDGKGGIYSKCYWFAKYRNLDICKELEEADFSETHRFPACEGGATL